MTTIRPREAWLTWAGDYNGYRFLADTPEALTSVVEPARREYRQSGRVPVWPCASHLLRGWLFLLYREDHFAGGYLFTDDGGSTAEWWGRGGRAQPAFSSLRREALCVNSARMSVPPITMRS